MPKTTEPAFNVELANVLRQQWCAEPTVHGGKSTRPDGDAGTTGATAC